MHKTLPKLTSESLLRHFVELCEETIEKLFASTISPEEARALAPYVKGMLAAAIAVATIAEKEAKCIEYREDH